jgi:DNA-binding transcriptional MerR regulator
MNTPPRLITLGVVAKMLNMKVLNARYYLQSRMIRPIGIAGNSKVYSEEDILALRDSIKPKPDAPKSE